MPITLDDGGQQVDPAHVGQARGGHVEEFFGGPADVQRGPDPRARLIHQREPALPPRRPLRPDRRSGTASSSSGCAFVSANAEAPPGSSIEDVTEDFRTWVRSLFLDLAKEAGAADPEHLAQQLVLLYDGAGISAWLDHDASTAQAAQAIATALVDAATPAPAAATAT